MSAVWIVYFSRAGENWCDGAVRTLRIGNTAFAAQAAENLTEADVFKVEAAEPYPAGYRDCVERAVRERRENARPVLAAWPEEAAVRACRWLILCYPNYCGSMPMPVWSFLSRYDWAGRSILPLCTHEGSGLGTSEADIAALCPGARVLPGLAVKGTKAQGAASDIEVWLRGADVPLAGQ